MAKSETSAPRSSRNVSIFDVARAAEVSIATVSRFINASGYVGEASRRRIEVAIRDLDFTPSTSARSLNTRRSHVIGFVVSSITHPYSAEVSRGIQDVAASSGYVLTISSTDGRSDLQVAALRTLHAHRVDAVIVTPPESPESDRYLDSLAKRGTVVVLIGRHLPTQHIDTVTTDTRSGAIAVMEHLLNLGHRRIAYIGGPWKLGGSRYDAYRETLERYAVALDPAYGVSAELTLAGGSMAMRALLAHDPAPTAVFCIDDLVAIGALQAARGLGFGVPKDLSIVGFDDDVYATLVEPPLTTVSQTSFDIGRIAAERALLRLNDESERLRPGEVIRLPCHLVVRRSTGPVPAINPETTDRVVGAKEVS